jgi:hypothetical protein
MPQFLMEMYYIITDIPRWLLCERAVRIDNGYLLHEYDPENDIYTDSGYASSLEDLRFIMSARYGWRKFELFLVRSFEEVAKMFASRFPRIIHLARADVFCIKRGDVLFNVKWDYDADGNLFFKKFEWFLGGEEPGTVAEALERLNEYAEKRDVWILLRELIKQATAYEVRPIP